MHGTCCKSFNMYWISADTTKQEDHPHETPGKPWEVIAVDLFSITNCNFLCIIDNYSKSLIVEKPEKLSADTLTTCCTIICAKYGLLKKTMSGTGINFISERFRHFCSTYVESWIMNWYFHCHTIIRAKGK